MKIALAGGVGGAKLVSGLARLLPPEELVIVVNTGDDFEHLGLNISPDIDTVMYMLAGIADPERGWGLDGETWKFMDALARLGGETWFRLGDSDLATHVERTRRLASGETLTSVTDALRRALGVTHRIIPMSDERAATVVHSDAGVLSFQDYFVRLRCEPRVDCLVYADQTAPAKEFAELLRDERLTGVIICPSNPMLSIEPILSLAGVRDAIRASDVPVVAVSPIVGGAALKGPAAKIMVEMGLGHSAAAVRDYYGELLTGFVLDEIDRDLDERIKGTKVRVCNTVMRTFEDRVDLAGAVLNFVASMSTATA